MPIPAIASLVSAVAPKVLGAVGAAAGAAAPSSTLNKDDFLKLLVSQLKNLLGRPVVASTATFQWSGQPVSLPYTIAAPVANAALEITDANGKTVGQMPLGARPAGQYNVAFAPSSPLPTGQYKYRIVSTDGGRSTPLSAIGGSVTGINMQNGQPVLQVGSVTINLADVTTIGTPTN